MPHSAVTQVNAFSVTITLAGDAEADMVASVQSAAVLAVRRMGHRSVRSVVATQDGAPVIHLDGLTPLKGMYVTAAEVRRAVETRLAHFP